MNQIKYEIKINKSIGHVDDYGNVYPLNYGYIEDELMEMA